MTSEYSEAVRNRRDPSVSPRPVGAGDASKLVLRFGRSEQDIVDTRVLSLEAHQEGRFRNYPFSMDKRDRLVRNAITTPQWWALIIAELGGEPVGFTLCSVGEYIVGTSALMTTVYGFYVRAGYRKSIVGGKASVLLIRACARWSKQRQSREILIHATSGINPARTDKFLRHIGFAVVGGNYALDLGKVKG